MAHAAAHSGAHDHGHHGDVHDHDHSVPAAWLKPENTTLPRGWGMPISIVLALVGVVLLVATVYFPFSKEVGGEVPAKAWKHAVASYHVGYVSTLGIMLGSLGLLLIFALVRAGWVASIKRPLEAAAGLLPLGLLLIAPQLVMEFAVKAGSLWKWRTPGLVETDAVLAHKAGYLNDGFFLARLGVYFLIWCYLAWRFTSVSREQDKTGNPQLTAKLGFTSCWGILAFALATAFAGFDLLKSMDFHWFSTMFGVYFFAGNTLVAIAVWAVSLVVLRGTGRLKGFFTAEHRHDIGKLMVAFTIFWAYIAFSQYFLIWYANIPEETAWVLVRGGGTPANEWTVLFWILAIGHFIAPFLVLLWRGTKRASYLLAVVALWLCAMHVADMFWVIRPIVYMLEQPAGGAHAAVEGLAALQQVALLPGKVGFEWVDITGVLAPICIFGAFYIRKLASAPIVAVNDPFLHEATRHKNVV